MKRVWTALGPAARLTVWKVLVISLACAVGQWVLFRSLLLGWPVEVTYAGPFPVEAAPSYPLLEVVADQAHLNWFFGAGLLLVCAALILPGLDRGAKTGYTLRRLSVGERALTLAWGGQNALLLLFFWGSQAAAALLLAWQYLATLGAEISGVQTLFLAFSRSPYLHALLPLWDWPLLLRNAAACAALGMSAAALPFHWRHGRRAGAFFFLAVVAACFFPCGMDSQMVGQFAGLALYASALALTVTNVWRGRWDED